MSGLQLNYSLIKSADGTSVTVPWELLRSIRLIDDDKSEEAEREFGFRYAHGVVLEFRNGLKLLLSCAEENDYSIIADNVSANEDATELFTLLGEDEYVTEIEYMKDIRGATYSILLRSELRVLGQLVSGEFDDLYDSSFGDRSLRLMDEMMLVFRCRELRDVDFIEKTGLVFSTHVERIKI